MTKVIMHGCNGKMGQVISDIISKDNDMEIVAGIDMVDHKYNGYPVFNDIEICSIKADVIIDFTSANAVDSLIQHAVQQKIPLVLCTTGLNDEQIEAVQTASQHIPILRSVNMSLGINVLLKLVASAAEVFSKAHFDIEIIERHHNQKIDAPSGTALALADAMNQVLQNEYEYKYDRHLEREKRDPMEIGIQSVRGGTMSGEHEVLYCGRDEVIEIKHIAYSKEIFANGAVAAAHFLANQPPGLYHMGHVIDNAQK